jgi:heterodisulfide reductase subunit C
MLNAIIKMIPIYVMGNRYEAPQGLTILKAMEFAGYRFKRGCGCRGGVCGACVTVYRKRGNYQLKVGLACQTMIEPDIDLVQLPFVPANKAIYTLQTVSANDSNIVKLYPELMRCLQCNTCTKSCPMDLDVMNYVAAAMRGDLKTVVDLSIECVMCGMCAARCPADLSPFNIALLVRRIYGRHVIPPSPQLKRRVEEIREGKYREELNRLKSLEKSELEEIFRELQAKKGASV